MVFFHVLPTWNQVFATAKLEFHETVIPTALGQTSDAFIMIDTGENETLGTDIYVTYNPSDITVTAVDSSGFFPEFVVQHNAATGKISIHSYVNTAQQVASGNGAVGVISFVPKKQTGTGALTMTCNSSSTATIVLNTQQQNILPCSQIRNVALDFTGQAGQQQEDPTPTPTRRPTARPTARPTVEKVTIPSFEDSFSDTYTDPVTSESEPSTTSQTPIDFPFAAFSGSDETPPSPTPAGRDLPTAAEAAAVGGNLAKMTPLFLGIIALVAVIWLIIKFQDKRKADQLFSNFSPPQTPAAPPTAPPQQAMPLATTPSPTPQQPPPTNTPPKPPTG